MNMLHDRQSGNCAGRYGQSLVGYSVLMVVVVAALLSMQVYMKRGMMGKLRAVADSVGGQYGPKETTANFTQTSHADTTTTSDLLRDVPVTPDLNIDVIRTTTTINDSHINRTGSESVGPLKKDLWE